MNDDRRVVVTGMSTINGLGHSVSETWENLVEGRSGIKRITIMDVSAYSCKIGAEVKNFDFSDYLPRKKSRHMAFTTKYGLIAAAQAIEHSAIDLNSLDLEMLASSLALPVEAQLRRQRRLPGHS